MKQIINIIAFAITLLTTVALGSCSSDEPNTKYTGDIDPNFISKFAGEGKSVIFDLNNVITYERAYNSAKGKYGDWHEIGPMTGWTYKESNAMEIINGRAWNTLSLMNITTGPSILYDPWKYYCNKTGFSKIIMTAGSFEFDANNPVTVRGDVTYKIEKAHGVEYNSSATYTYTNTNDGIKYMRKSICFYTVRTATINPDDYLCFESGNEAKIAMIRMMRKYYGDVVNLLDIVDEKYKDNYAEHPLLDLAAVEDDIINGRDEKYSWYKQYYPESVD